MTRKRSYKPFTTLGFDASDGDEAKKAIELLNEFASLVDLPGRRALAKALCLSLPTMIARRRRKVKAKNHLT